MLMYCAEDCVGSNKRPDTNANPAAVQIEVLPNLCIIVSRSEPIRHFFKIYVVDIARRIDF
jgi:hypothetical protein